LRLYNYLCLLGLGFASIGCVAFYDHAAHADEGKAVTMVVADDRFFDLVKHKKYAEAEKEAWLSARDSRTSLDYVKNSPIIPKNKKRVYLKKPIASFEVLVATGRTKEAEELGNLILDTAPGEWSREQLTEAANRAGNQKFMEKFTTVAR
jgi:hypothetical protein